MKLTDFSGGLNVRVHPTLIAPTESQKYYNCDNEAGILRPVKGNKSTDISSHEWFAYFYAKNRLVSAITETWYAEYRSAMYSLTIDGMKKTSDGIIWRHVGISAPTQAPTATKQDIGNLLGTYRYVITFYNSTDGAESEPSSLSKEQEINKPNVSETGTVDTVLIQNTDSYKASVELVNIMPWLGSISQVKSAYLIASGEQRNTTVSSVNRATFIDSLFATRNITDKDKDLAADDLLDVFNSTSVCSGKIIVTGIQQPNESGVDKIRLYRIGGTLADYTLVAELNKGTTSYLDNKADWDIAGNHVLDSFNFNSPKAGMKYLIENNSMLFAARKDKLYYSEIDNPDAWPSTYFIDFPQPITGIGGTQNGLLVFTFNNTYIVTGNSPTTFSKYLLSAEQGCIKHDTIQFNNNALTWVSHDGICMSSGGQLQLISQTHLGKLMTADSASKIKNAVVYDRMYFLVTTENTLVLDFRYNKCFRVIENTERLGRFNDVLYSYNDSGKLDEMFAGDELTLHYKSPIYTEGSLSTYKVYKDFYISYTGNITISIYVDSVEVFNKTLDPLKEQYNAKSLGTKQGYGLSFDIRGTGEVHEINYTVVGRENGR